MSDKDKVIFTTLESVSIYGYDGKLVSRRDFPPKDVTVADMENAVNKLTLLASDVDETTTPN